MEGWARGRMDRWTDGRVSEQKHEWADGRTGRYERGIKE